MKSEPNMSVESKESTYPALIPVDLWFPTEITSNSFEGAALLDIIAYLEIIKENGLPDRQSQTKRSMKSRKEKQSVEKEMEEEEDDDDDEEDEKKQILHKSQSVVNWFDQEDFFQKLYDFRTREQASSQCNILQTSLNEEKHENFVQLNEIIQEKLTLTLRPYQLQAVSWMLKIEQRGVVYPSSNYFSSTRCLSGISKTDTIELAKQGRASLYPLESHWNPMWLPICAPLKPTVESIDQSESLKKFAVGILWVNWLTGQHFFDQSTIEKEELWFQPECIEQNTPKLKGGILADEMGLGKTIEMLSLFLIHTCPSSINENMPTLDSMFEKFNLVVRETDKKTNPISMITPMHSSIDEETTIMQCLCGSSNFARIPVSTNKKSKNNRISNLCEYTVEKENFTSTNTENSTKEHGALSLPFSFEKFDCIMCVCCSTWQHRHCVGWTASHNRYLCSNCIVQSLGDAGIRAKTTLIITPESIVQQWIEELQNHTKPGTLQIKVYQGVHAEGFVSPWDLRQNDVIVTSYQVLRRELYHANISIRGSSLNRRKRPRYSAIPSPLPCLLWWRICLDEAQMVESVVANAAKMTSRLSAVHRWCVTGTPMQKSVDDLYGLLVFLRASPFCERALWNKLIRRCDMRDMISLFVNIMWRSRKKDVEMQVCLPTQQYFLTCSSLSAIETHFYRIRLEETANSASKMIGSLSRELMDETRPLDRHQLRRALHPLLKLRQACCHPQIGAKNSTLRMLPLGNHPMSMTEVLSHMVKRADRDCEESVRLVLYCLNGLAACSLLPKFNATERHPINSESLNIPSLDLKPSIDDLIESLKLYREAIHIINQHEGVIECDKLQKLHTFYNCHQVRTQIQEVIEEKRVNDCDSTNLRDISTILATGMTLRESNADVEASQLRQNYIRDKNEIKIQKDAAVYNVSKEIDENNIFGKADLHTYSEYQRSQPSRPYLLWWDELLRFSGGDQSMIDRVKSALIEAKHSVHHIHSSQDDFDQIVSLANRFTNADGLRSVIVTELDCIISARKKLKKLLAELSKDPTPQQVYTASNCRYCRQKRGPKCQFCMYVIPTIK